jgi:hypothetical protein
MSQSSEFCRHNTLFCFSVNVIVVYFVIDSVREVLDTPAYCAYVLNETMETYFVHRKHEVSLAL